MIESLRYVIIICLLPISSFGQVGFELLRLIPSIDSNEVIATSTISDFNGDGLLDVVFASETHDVFLAKKLYLYCFLQDGFGGFNGVKKIQYADQAPPRIYVNDMKSADVTGDGKPDLLLALSTVKGILIFEQDAQLVLKQTDTLFLHDYVRSMEVAKISDTAKTSIIALEGSGSYDGGDSVVILTRQQDSTWSRTGFEAPIGNVVYPDMAVGDFNQDGRLDVSVIGSDNDTRYITAFIYLQKSNHTFQSRIAFDRPMVSQNLTSVLSGDFNNDGIDDLALTSGGTSKHSRLAIWYQSGSGFFSFPQLMTNDYGAGATSSGHFSCGDTADDILIVQDTTFSVNEFVNGFIDSSAYVWNFGWGAMRREACLSVGDFDGDGLCDMALAARYMAMVGINTSELVVVSTLKDSLEVEDSATKAEFEVVEQQVIGFPVVETDTSLIFSHDSVVTTTKYLVNNVYTSVWLVNEENRCENYSLDTVYFKSLLASDTTLKMESTKRFMLSDTVPKLMVEHLELRIYPNPSNGWIRIALKNPNNTSVAIEIFDSTGQLVKLLEVTIEASVNLPSGAYILRLPRYNITEKIIVAW